MTGDDGVDTFPRRPTMTPLSPSSVIRARPASKSVGDAVGRFDVLILLPGVSVSLHPATAFTGLALRAGRSAAESVLAAGGAAAAGMFSLWLAVVGLYR